MDFESYDRQECAKPAAIYVLRHFQPSLEKKATPKPYVKKTVMDLMPDEQPDLDKMISGEIGFVVGKVRFNADWFTADAYLKRWRKYFKEFLDENTAIRESLQALQSSLNDTDEQFDLMMNSLSELQQMLGASYGQWHRRIMAEFLESNLPLELYSLYNISYIGNVSAIKSFAADLTGLQTKLLLVRSNEKKVTSELKEFERRHRRLSGLLTSALRSESTLRFFLKTANAKKLEDLFKTKPLVLNGSTERKRFEEYLGEFKQNLFALTSHMDKTRLDEDIALNFSGSESFDDFDEKLRQTILKHA